MNAEVKIIVEDIVARPSTSSEFQIDPSLREIMCYLDDGRLLVAKSAAFNPHVRGFVARLQRTGHSPAVMHVEMSVIAKAYENAKQDNGLRSATDMQRVAMLLFDTAVEMRASDIHIKVSKKWRTRIFVRVHNDREFIQEHPYDYGAQLCATIYHAMTDVSDATFETMSRQDARISDRNKLPRSLDGIRVATSPQVDGFVMVLRLLYNDAADSFDLADLGYSNPQINGVNLMKRRPSGINLIGGPTGSGKSTTLQRTLGAINIENQGRKHIISVEDPPEYPIPEVTQTPVANAETEEERSRAFQSAIKAAMRLDPDVIMIGEIRDAPSARLAVQAAMTGHQVWSSVHANSALGILDRIKDLGISTELVCDPTVFTGLICQRLVKVLCPECKVSLVDQQDRYKERDMRRIMGVTQIDRIFVIGDGCPHCSDRGTIGRTVVSEIVITDERLMSHLRNNDRMGAINYWRKEQGGKTMLEHTIEKVNAGIIDPFLAEVVVGPLNIGVIEDDFRVETREIGDAV